MERELQYKQNKKRAIVALSVLLAIIVVFNIILWLIAINSNNGVKSVGTITLETHFFDGQKETSTSFPKSEFVSEGSFDRLLVLNNKSKDCYLRFWLVSKMGGNENSLTEVNDILTMSAVNSFASSGYEYSIVKNERYLKSSENKIYYTTDNESKESVFQKNTTASILLTFDVAALGEEYLSKVYSFEILIEAVEINDPSVSNWVKPAQWPKES